MFDDPKKELERLQEELLAEEEPEIGEYEEDLTEGFEEFFDDELDEDDDYISYKRLEKFTLDDLRC